MIFRVLIAAGVVASGLAVASPAEAAPLWSSCFNTSSGNRVCNVITSNTENSRAIAWRDSVQNLTRSTISATCQAETSKTFTWGLSVSMTAEMKAPIFGGIQTTVNPSVQRSTTTGYVTSATFSVPAGATRHCDRGTVRERVKGYTKVGYYSAGSGGWNYTYWSAQAPTSARWWIY
ncbi:hypothetical protein [Nocardioides sp.]|uniref:hypothetical protein n=1 Tax=Nocardioides sp. TaxID=35761 RepID=UPI002B84AF55|nr:hypothetical protein [Nocardioides sp.]HSX68314.1 hypothetical protein [Nocardioides sp.]